MAHQFRRIEWHVAGSRVCDDYENGWFVEIDDNGYVMVLDNQFEPDSRATCHRSQLRRMAKILLEIADEEGN